MGLERACVGFQGFMSGLDSVYLGFGGFIEGCHRA